MPDDLFKFVPCVWIICRLPSYFEYLCDWLSDYIFKISLQWTDFTTTHCFSVPVTKSYCLNQY